MGLNQKKPLKAQVDDEVIGDSYLTNSLSDSDYELPNVEQENNEKDVE